MREYIDIQHVSVRSVTFGRGVKIIEPSNVYDATLGDDVFVGPFVEIQRGVVIGHRTRIQSHAFLCELVTIGDDCVVSHGAKFINDPYASGGPARGDRRKWRSTRIGDRVAIGTNATILPVTICSDTIIGAGAVVTHDIDEPGVYAGVPARRLK